MESKKVRCKVLCTEVAHSAYKNGSTLEKQFKARFTPVYGDSPENKEFFKYTPSGSIELGTIREHLFEAGKEYYVDFTPAAD